MSILLNILIRIMKNVVAGENLQNIADGIELKILRVRQDALHFPDDILKWISLMTFAAFLFQIS